MATIKILANNIALTTANDCWNATFVRVVNTTAGEANVAIANTRSPENEGGISGNFVLEAGQTEIIIKEPTDTIASDVEIQATPVARY